jgi:predicted MFS family arabinose efflux permease
MALVLPPDPQTSHITYAQALASLRHLWVRQKPLRRATFMQAGFFGSFSVFWTILALHLEQKPFDAGPGVAGLFGVLGAAGIFAAPIAGRLADARGPRLAIAVGGALALLSWAAFGFWVGIPGLIVGVILLDFGVQSALVSNQHIIYALDPAARSRINTIFMTGMFLGGAAGSAGAMFLWREGGWPAVCLLGAALAASGLLLVKPGAP